MPDQTDLAFRFRYLRDGEPAHSFLRKGRLTDVMISLGKESVALSDVYHVEARRRRLVITVYDEVELPPKAAKCLVGDKLVLETKSSKARQFESHANPIIAQRVSEGRRRDLTARGEGHLHRTVECPECSCTINLSGHDVTEYFHCRFCDSVSTLPNPGRAASIVTSGDTHHHCEECGLFGRIRPFTDFYFYFFIVLYAFTMSRTYLCDNCATSIGWRMLWKNLLCLVGVPFAIWVLIKAKLRGAEPLNSLPPGNALALRGDYRNATAEYERIERRLPYANHPGILFNRARAHGYGDDGDGMEELIDSSLAACSNYLPTVQWMREDA